MQSLWTAAYYLRRQQPKCVEDTVISTRFGLRIFIYII